MGAVTQSHSGPGGAAVAGAAASWPLGDLGASPGRDLFRGDASCAVVMFSMRATAVDVRTTEGRCSTAQIRSGDLGSASGLLRRRWRAAVGAVSGVFEGSSWRAAAHGGARTVLMTVTENGPVVLPFARR